MTTEELMKHAGEALRIIRILTAADETMRYGVMLRLVGVIPADGQWHIRYRRLASQILYAAAAVAKLNKEKIAKGRGEPGIEFWRFVNTTGDAGAGIYEDVALKVAD